MIGALFHLFYSCFSVLFVCIILVNYDCSRNMAIADFIGRLLFFFYLPKILLFLSTWLTSFVLFTLFCFKLNLQKMNPLILFNFSLTIQLGEMSFCPLLWNAIIQIKFLCFLINSIMQFQPTWFRFLKIALKIALKIVLKDFTTIRYVALEGVLR